MKKLSATFQAAVFFGLLVGCSAGGSAGSADGGPTWSDAAGERSDASSAHDAGPPQARCDPGQPFGPPTPLPATSALDAQNPWLSADERTLLFTNFVPTYGLEVYVAERETADAAFPTPQSMTGVNGINSQYSPSLSSDGLTLYYVRQGYSAYFSRRESTEEEFGIGDPLSLGPPPSMRIHTPRRKQSGIYYMGWRDDEDSEPTLYRDVNDTWEQSVVLAHPDLQSYALSQDERTLYFSTADGVHRATRTEIDQPFEDAVLIPDLDLRVGWISVDDCVLYGSIWLEDASATQIVRAVRGGGA